MDPDRFNSQLGFRVYGICFACFGIQEYTPGSPGIYSWPRSIFLVFQEYTPGVPGVYSWGPRSILLGLQECTPRILGVCSWILGFASGSRNQNAESVNWV